MKFYAMHTIDESGARAANNEGWQHGEFDNIFAAIAAVDGVAGGYVRREDGAVLAPDGNWIGEKNTAAVELGRLGGSAKSEKKSKSSAANGASGGRPKKRNL